MLVLPHERATPPHPPRRQTSITGKWVKPWEVSRVRPKQAQKSPESVDVQKQDSEAENSNHEHAHSTAISESEVELHESFHSHPLLPHERRVFLNECPEGLFVGPLFRHERRLFVHECHVPFASHAVDEETTRDGYRSRSRSPCMLVNADVDVTSRPCTLRRENATLGYGFEGERMV
ncbi:hypothetical protein M011DRAFT_336053 [Sporormia fimetaria CBS 119925]|uniref:Uncharacterized protein n=1 Tax=Sporormia fimetaria CBS 119925 TaxID=1340428 RepID=A0A6A6VDS0_9PLEO|nr:hypothetical protein M011DRAFT_336053 [Sporormia fimetaria CBS 119925]